MDERGEIDSLWAGLYEELRRLARRHRGRSATLQPTALVHEAFLKLADRVGVNDRAHLRALAARAMRQVLVDAARERGRAKRGGDQVEVTFDEEVATVEAQSLELLELQRALEAIEAREPLWGRVVECRYFAGMTDEETAAALGLSLRSAQRAWSEAKRALRAALDRGGAG